jgi:hypothetical protein
MVAIQNIILAVAASAVMVEGAGFAKIFTGKRDLEMRGSTNIFARGKLSL